MSETKQPQTSQDDRRRIRAKAEEPPHHHISFEPTGADWLDPAPSAILRKPSASAPAEARSALQSDPAQPTFGGRDFSGVPAHAADHPAMQPTAGDRFEQEADRVAGQVTAMPAPVQRQAPEEEDEIRASRGSAADSFEAGDEFESRLAAQRGGGGPLPGAVRTFMEPRFGADFSGVRVHTGGEAAQLNRAISARAFTHGQDIFLGEGREDLESSAAQRLLAHELTHVLQQSAAVRRKNGPVAPVRVAGRQARGIQRVGGTEAQNRELKGKLGKPKTDWIIAHPTETVTAWLAKKDVVLNPFKRMSEEEFKEAFKLPAAPENVPAATPPEPAPTGAAELAAATAPPPPPPPPEGATMPGKIPMSPEELEKRAIDDGFGKHERILYETAPEGSFQYVAAYIYQSVESKEVKKSVYLRLYQVVKTGDKITMEARKTDEIDDREKREILESMIDDAFKQYTEEDLSEFALLFGDPTGEKMTIDRFLGKVREAMQKKKKVEGGSEPDVTEKSLPQGVGIGFHGTSGPPSQVATPSESGGWGGLKKTQTVSTFRTRYALDATWNPLDEFLKKGSFYRRGGQWDNELLSTVSIAFEPAPAIKFPFPSSGAATADTWLYATILQKGYPTFKIQKEPFPEVAVKEVKPENLIGATLVHKEYKPSFIQHIIKSQGLSKLKPADFKEQTHEKFAYYIIEFITYPYFRNKWGPEAEKIIDKAKERIKTDIGDDRTWGIYDFMKITKR